MKHPYSRRLLNCMSLKLNMKNHVEDLESRATIIEKACNELLNSEKFKMILSYILMIGNYLNNEGEEAKRVKIVKAFAFDSFNNLSGTKGYDKKTTLLQFLERVINAKQPDLFQVRQELPTLEDATHESFDGIRQEVDALTKQQQDVSNELKASKQLKQNGHAHPDIQPDLDESISRLSEFLGTVQTILGELTTNIQKARDTYDLLVSKYCQDPKQKSEDLFSQVLTFLLQLEACHRNEDEKRERMKERKRKEEEMAAMKRAKEENENEK